MADTTNVPSLLEALGKGTKDERASALAAMIGAAIQARHRFTWIWERNRAFIRGHHFGTRRRFGKNRLRWNPAPQARAEIVKNRVVVNHLEKISDQVGAIGTQERPKFDASAASDEGIDLHVSRHSADLLKWVWRAKSLEDLYKDLFQFAFDEGYRGLWVYWDSEDGPLVEVEEAVQPEKKTVHVEELGEDVEILQGEVEIKVKFQRGGALIFRMLEPEMVIVPAYSRNDQDHEWICVREFTSMSSIRNRFGEAAMKEIVPTQNDQHVNWDSDTRIRLPGVSETADQMESEVVEIFTLYARSGRKPLERGQKVIFTRTMILSEKEDNPVYPTEDEPAGMWPYYGAPIFPFRWKTEANSYYGKAGLNDLIPLQKELNGVESKIKIILAKHSHARRKVPRGQADWDDEDPSAAIEYNSLQGGPDSISWEQPPNFPTELLSQSQSLRAQMDEISGINAAIQGNASSEDSGIKVRQEQQRATGRLAPKKAKFDRVMGQALLHALILMRRHMDFNQQMLIVGENGETSARMFQDATLTGMVDVFPVNNPLSSDPMTKVAQLNQIAQILTNVEDPVMRNRMLGLLDLSDALHVKQTMDVHRDRAIAENAKMMLGEPVEISPFDDDVGHLDEHIAQFLSEEGRKATTPQPDDDQEVATLKAARLQAHNTHIQDHNSQLQFKMGAAPQNQAAAGGQAGAVETPNSETPSSAAQPRPAIA